MVAEYRKGATPLGHIGLLCGNVGLFCGNTELFCSDIWLFFEGRENRQSLGHLSRKDRALSVDIRLFYRHIGLFCGSVGLFCGNAGLQKYVPLL